MSKAAMQKTRILTLWRLFSEETDEERGLSVGEIISRFAEVGITAERKSVYDDVAALQDFGLDIAKVREGNRTEYRLLSRDFELAELKILVDAVQAAKFITPKKSDELIAKLSGLTSRRKSNELARFVYVSDRAKSMNESVYYAVDTIHSAIRDNRKVSFLYYDLNEKKEKVFRHGGMTYVVSPYGLTVDDGKYYLIAYDSAAGKLKHYRVDKTQRLEVCDEIRDRSEEYRDLNVAKYATEHFGMFGGEETLVTMRCENRLAQIVLDRFGSDVQLRPADADHFEFSVRIVVSVHFLTWALSLAPEMTVVSPQKVVTEMRSLIEHGARTYEV